MVIDRRLDMLSSQLQFIKAPPDEVTSLFAFLKALLFTERSSHCFRPENDFRKEIPHHDPDFDGSAFVRINTKILTAIVPPVAIDHCGYRIIMFFHNSSGPSLASTISF